MLAPGDIFAWQHARRPGRFHFGRVVSTEANLTGIPEVHCILIYLYRAWSLDKHAIPDLRHDLLLLPPIGTNRLGWTRGYFETVARQPLTKADVLPQHCFTDGASFLDEHGRYLPGPVEPVGRYGLAGIGLIDELIGIAFD
ncbi:hypothetical protein AB595_12630 [Massilia sp. WF1]|nr:hypothetical protein AB595_12630 [Massilia sp. WF1]